MDYSKLHKLNVGADVHPPLLFTNPFSYVPHPLCLEATREVRAYVEGHEEWSAELRRGKMFGVMVVRGEDGSDYYYLAAFSGQLNGESEVEGFVPPIFDVARSAYFQEEMHEIERLIAHKEERKRRSEALQDWLFSQYRCKNALGGEKNLIEIFTDYYRKRMLKQEHYDHNAASHHIPSGSGECCAPKLLQYAYLNHLLPVCMAEFWVQTDTADGSSQPSTGATYKDLAESVYSEVRKDGRYYPACHKKCRPILSFMLEGLHVEQSLLERQDTELLRQVEIVYEDARILVIDKPAGLLSVPGRGTLKSVADWIQACHPLPDYWFVHRLDQDTCGLLVIAKDEATYKALQQQFIQHEVQKTYEALVDGEVAGDEGKIKLRMRPDPDDPPRQLVDKNHGKQAVTR